MSAIHFARFWGGRILLCTSLFLHKLSVEFPGSDRFGVGISQGQRADLQGTLSKGERLAQIALFLREVSHVMKRLCRLWMLLPKLLLSDGECLLIMGLRFRVPALITCEVRQAIKRQGHIGTFSPLVLLIDP